MKKYLRDENGQTALEYVLIIAVLVLVLVAGIPPLREAVQNVIDSASSFLTPNP